MDKRIENLKSELKQLLLAQNGVVAAWEGGSAATGYLDEYSDLDLSIVVDSVEPDAVFALLEGLFAANYGILDKFRMPEPTWHGMSQCFYLLDKLPSLFYCDIAVAKSDNPHKLTETDRHGNAVVWFDKQHIYQPALTPKDELDALANKYYHIATDTAFLFLIELKKALARKNWIASQMNYNTFINRNLVILMNLKYRPWKVDFGIRYAERDYPPEAAQMLESLLKITSCEDIEQHLNTALELYYTLKAELSSKFSLT